MDAILEIRHMYKSFPGTLANDDVTLSVERGEVHTLLGENGAGKSTLMNIISGLYSADSGEIFFDGKPVTIKSPKKAVELGIGMVHQHFMLVQAMDVIDNIILGMRTKAYPFLGRRQAEKDILALGEKYGLDVCPTAKIEELSVGEQQRAEIIKALYRGAELLILDEPTAVLTPDECKGLFRVIDLLKREGKAIIFISHKMKEVMAVSDRITVLRKGKVIETVEKSQTSKEALARLMIGRDLPEGGVQKRGAGQNMAFEAKGICLSHGPISLRDLDITVHSGEILGIAGVDGNGQSELALLASGMLAPKAGEIRICGEKVERYSPRSFYRHKVAHIPEDRNRYGLIGGMSIEENLFLKNVETPPASRWKGWYLDHDRIHRQAETWKTRFDIRASSTGQKAADLSGGNQQKVILARELSNEPKFLIAVHPTRGLDVGATNFIHKEIVKMRDRGCGVLLISADLDEVLLLSDRIGVMYEGAITGYEDGTHPNMDTIAQLMAGRREEGICSEA